ncbi:Ribosylnicotinamide kinase [Indibacter alkaliphilus LW1]|uniref:Ribosylnicotinamide kinase n=1 Tax=Indibacter alkaliphilus (strain CCUG 57479 / KCTC 22604 / LW1) TaxID=1189612 RepID=S2DQP6_INDAL|nr:ATP-binding protein [Indibacter alkaliphilus]EOZ92203.1 Ribosylnicotinamide kinase [Indibacter alkaliphilus LW1]
MLKKVVILGPESTGKSTLAEALAKHFDCPWVPEFAREYVAKLTRPYTFDDLEEIARGQIRLEDLTALSTEQLLICDTDLLVLKVWSQHKYGTVSPWIEEQIGKRKYDLYLVTDIDIPWSADPQREYPEPEMRQYFFDWYKKLAAESGVPYRIISGKEKERKALAVQIIQEQLIKIN